MGLGSRIRRLRAWLHHRRHRLAERMELAGWQIRRARARTLRLLGHLFAPLWLRHLLAAVAQRLVRARRSLLRTQHQVAQSVTQSAVGEQAKRLAEGSKRLESRLTIFFVEGAKFLGTIAGGLIPYPLRRAAAYIASHVGRAVQVLTVFVARWFSTRHYWHLLGGLPAFLLALPLAYCMIRMPFYTADEKAKHYRRAAVEALQKRDFTTANLYYRKLAQLGAMNDVVEYQSAINTFESGDEEEAIGRMKRLAPEDQPGFAPAHIWLARHYLSDKSPLPRKDSNALADRHLAFALDRDPGNLEARSLRALHMQRTGRWEEAASELRQVVKQLPERGLSLAEVYARQGRWDAARREVDKVLQIFREKQTQEEQLDAYEYLTWSYGYRILGQLEQAESVLWEGLERHPDHKQLKQQLHPLLISIASDQFDHRAGDPQRVVDRLLQAYELDPSDNRPLILLANATLHDSPFGRHLRQAVAELLDHGDPPDELYAIVAPLLVQLGDLTMAVRYLNKAIELNAQDSYSLNNLAYCLLQTGGQDERALELVNRALEIEPDQAMYRDTRGHLLLRIGRYRDAIEDLVVALNGLGDHPEIHTALATAYAELGETEQASLHRQLAR